uniref:Vitellogenin domain-containing protein n=1 Tax=Lutzomyia longipalpis TaxID=7200 RepID=A0A1B0CL35_LUTLO
MQLNLIVIFAIVGFIGVSAVSHHQLPFHHVLRSMSEDSFSVYNVTLTTKSGIVKSSFESKVEVLMKMIIRPYKNSTIHVRVEEEKGTATNENIYSSPPDELFDRIEPLQNFKNFEFLLTQKGQLILRKDEKDINARKAIASLLLFDWKALPEKSKSYNFHFLRAIYGDCYATTSVKWDKELQIEQNYYPNHCYDFQKIAFNTDDANVAYKTEALHMKNHRKFYFSQNPGKYFLKKLEAKQYIFLSTGQSNDIEHFLHTFYDIQHDEEAEIATESPSEQLFDFASLHDIMITPLVDTLLVNESYKDVVSFPDEGITKEEMYQEIEGILKHVAGINEAEIVQDPYSDIVERTERLTKSEDYAEQVEIIQALGNLQDYKISFILSNYNTTNEDLMIHIMSAIAKTSFGHQDIIHYFQDIIMQDLPTEVRAFALSLIIKKYRGNQSLNFDMLARRLHEDKDHELYNMFVSSAQILIDQEELPWNANTVLGRMNPAARSRRFFWKPQGNAKNSFALGGHIIFDNKTRGFKQLQFEILQKSPYGAYKSVSSFLLRASDVALISRLNNFGTEFFEQKNFTYELILSEGSRTVFSTVAEYDFDSLKAQLIHFYQGQTFDLIVPRDFSRFDISSINHFDYFFPTDSGKYARFYDQTPLAIDFKLQTNSKTEGNKKIYGFVFSLNATLQNAWGMEIFQPNLMAFQGTRESSNFHFVQQIALDCFYDPNKNDYRNWYIAKNKDLDPLLELNYRKNTEIYLNPLKESNATKRQSAPTFIEVTDDKRSTHESKEILAEGHLSDLGIYYNMEILRCQAPRSDCSFSQSLSEMMNRKPFSDAVSHSPGDFLASLITSMAQSFTTRSIYGVQWNALMQSSKAFDTAKIGLRIQKETKITFFELSDRKDKVRVNYMFNLDAMQFVRIPAGGLATALCIDFEIYQRQMPEWKMEIFYGHYEGKNMKCPKYQTEIYIEGSSNFNEEQLEYTKIKSLTYAQCRPASEILPSEEAENTYTCAKAATMFRDIVMWVHYKNIQPEAADFFRSLGFWLFSNSNTFRKSAEGAKSSGTFDIGIYRPMHSDEDFEMTLSTPEDTFTVKGSSKWFLMENSAFQSVNSLIEDLFASTICRIYPEDLPHNATHWTLVGQMNDNHLVFAQRFGEDQLSLRISTRNQEMKFFPRDDDVQYDVHVSENEIDSMPMSYTKNRLSTISVGHTIFILGQYLWRGYNAAIGYNGKNLPHNATHWTLVGQMNDNHLVFAQRFGEDQLSLRISTRNQEMKFFPRDDDVQYDVHVSENEIDSMPMSYTKNRLSTISVGHTIFILGQYLWRGYNAAIGYNGKSIFVKASQLVFSKNCDWV